MYRAGTEARAEEAVAHLLQDIAQAIADQANVDVNGIRIGTIDLGSPESAVDMTKAISVQCTAVSKQTGKQCKAKAIPGGTVCRWHGGAASQVKAKAAIRAEVMNWGLGDSHIDPGEICFVW